MEGLDIVKIIESCGSQTGKTSAVVTIAESGVVGSYALDMDGTDSVSNMDGADGANNLDGADGANNLDGADGASQNVFVR